MEIFNTLLVILCKKWWAAPTILMIIILMPTLIMSKNIKKSLLSVVGGLFIIGTFVYPMWGFLFIDFFGNDIGNELIQKYGERTSAVFYATSDSGVSINDYELDDYHLVYKTKEGEAMKATMLETEFGRVYQTYPEMNKKIEIAYMPLYPSLVAVMPKKSREEMDKERNAPKLQDRPAEELYDHLLKDK